MGLFLSRLWSTPLTRWRWIAHPWGVSLVCGGGIALLYELWTSLAIHSGLWLYILCLVALGTTAVEEYLEGLLRWGHHGDAHLWRTLRSELDLPWQRQQAYRFVHEFFSEYDQLRDVTEWQVYRLVEHLEDAEALRVPVYAALPHPAGDPHLNADFWQAVLEIEANWRTAGYLTESPLQTAWDDLTMGCKDGS